MTIEILKNQIIEQIENLSEAKLIELNNTYCQSINASDSEVYSNDEDFFNTFFEGQPAEVARSISFGSYKYGADWVRFNGYGNLESIDRFGTDDLCELVATIAEYAIENQQDFEDILDFSESDEV